MQHQDYFSKHSQEELAVVLSDDQSLYEKHDNNPEKLKEFFKEADVRKKFLNSILQIQ